MRISSHCFAVTGLAYWPPWSVNAGFVAGAHTTLVVDTGATALSAASIYGYAAAVAPANRIIVVNAEKHFDHVGGNAYFRERGAELYGHPGIRRTDEEFRREMEEFNGLITDAARREAHEEAAFYWGTSIANPDRDAAELDGMELGDCQIRIIPTPGHTPTNISVFIPEDSVLFCGDCLTSRYAPNLTAGGPAEWKQWLESLERIEAFNPQTVMPGHGPVIQGAREVRRAMEAVRVVLRMSVG